MSELDAIYEPERSLVVVAAAGTGKTWRLVRRYLSLVATCPDGGSEACAPVERVAAVTFTRAAAAEMRERVLAALAVGADDVGDGDPVMARVVRDRDRIVDLAERVAAAPIDTIHGLCARVLREFPELSGLSPDARPLEPGEDGVRRSRFVARFVDEILDTSDHPLRGDCRALLAAYSLEDLRQELSTIVDGAEDIPEDWQDAEAAREVRDALRRSFWRGVLEQVRPVVSQHKAALELRRAAAQPGTKAAADIEAKVQAFEAVEALGAHAGPEEAARALQAVGKLPYKGLGTKERDLPARAAIDAVKRAYADATTIRGVSIKLHDDSEAHVEHLGRWIRLGRAARAAYQEELGSLGLVRFDDLERRMLHLLGDPAAQEQLCGRFEHILVDEFQDTNRRQVALVEGLAAACGGARTFFVGDPKQSIYRFRGAEVDVFQEEVAKAHAREDVVELPDTYRTAPKLNAFFNAWFPRIFDERSAFGPEDLRDVRDGAPVPWPEDGVTAARDGAAMEGLPVDLLLRSPNADLPVEGEDGEAGPRFTTEYDRVAAYVDSLLDEPLQRTSDPESAPLRPRDVAILVPKWKLAEPFRAALSARGIPAQVAGGRGLLERPEVRDLVNLVRFWANRDDDLAAVGVLRGPAFGLTDLGLYVLARWPGVDLVESGEDPEVVAPWEIASPEGGGGPSKYSRPVHGVAIRGRLDPERAVDALLAAGVLDPAERDARLDQLRGDAQSLERGRSALRTSLAAAGARPTSEVLADVIAGFRLEACWLAQEEGRRAVANAWRFVEVVRGLEAEGADLDTLCAWFDSDANPGTVGLLSAEADAVTITTRHGSKGLEWPVVVLASIGERSGGGPRGSWSCEDVPEPGASNGDRVCVPRVREARGGFQYLSDPLQEACGTLGAPLEAAEEKRLMYVAMTRARERVALSGELSDKAGVLSDNPPFPKEWVDGSKKDLAGEHAPLFTCKGLADFVVAGLELSPPDTERTWYDVPRGSRWAEFVRVVRDEDLPVVQAPGDDGGRDAPTASSPRIEEAIAWGPTGRITQHTPSANRLPEGWKGVERLWRSGDARSGTPIAVPDDDERGMGDLFHAMMERWNFQGPAPGDTLCRDVAERFFPGGGERHAGWLRTCLTRLDESPFGAELKRAAERGEVFHEVPVDVVVDGSHRVTGRIDLLYRDDDGAWRVVDYKVSRKSLAELESTYWKQLELYRRALAAHPCAPERLGLWHATVGAASWYVPSRRTE